MDKIKYFISDLTRRYSSRAFMSVCIAVGMFSLHPAEFGGGNLVAVLIAFMGYNAVDNYVKIKKAENGKEETQEKVEAK